MAVRNAARTPAKAARQPAKRATPAAGKTAGAQPSMGPRSKRGAKHSPPARAAPAVDAPARRPKPTDDERFPGLHKNAPLRRALAIHRAMQAGKSREEAEASADAKVGPRSRKVLGRGPRPQAPKRQRVKPAARRSR